MKILPETPFKEACLSFKTSKTNTALSNHNKKTPSHADFGY
jgi:hypothetical protein